MAPDRHPQARKSVRHLHDWQSFHADYCHTFENGEMCRCGDTRNVEALVRDFRDVHSGWWHWGRAGCLQCEELMRQAGLDPAALGDEDLACREIERQYEAVR